MLVKISKRVYAALIPLPPPDFRLEILIVAIHIVKLQDFIPNASSA